MDSGTQIQKTWFGIPAKVTIRGKFLHKAGIGPLMIPHPGIANWLLRKGLPELTARKLTYSHEFAHFYTLPLVIIYGGLLITWAVAFQKLGYGRIILILASVQAIWELLSEMRVIFMNREHYKTVYRDIPFLPQCLFWGLGIVLVCLGWF